MVINYLARIYISLRGCVNLSVENLELYGESSDNTEASYLFTQLLKYFHKGRLSQTLDKLTCVTSRLTNC